VTDRSTDGARWRRRARWLLGATIAWDLVEAGVALYSGLRAASIALTGFGLDSLIEIAAAYLVLRRLSASSHGADPEAPEALEAGERRVERAVGLTFLFLAAYVAVEAGYTLVSGGEPAVSDLGIAVAAAALVVMPLLAWGKLRAARALESRALAAEARESLACGYLSLTLLLGLGAHAAFGWAWADPVAALLMVPWLIREGREGLEGDDD
jgi:divalent metal cation (Fe/Co/Zn/Cd) transporter